MFSRDNKPTWDSNHVSGWWFWYKINEASPPYIAYVYDDPKNGKRWVRYQQPNDLERTWDIRVQLVYTDLLWGPACFLDPSEEIRNLNADIQTLRVGLLEARAILDRINIK